VDVQRATSPARAPVVCVSPHLDDGVFSCGQVLARHPGSTLVTVFAGGPDRESGVTRWDHLSGFGSSAAAMAARRREDEAAARTLAADVVHLRFRDAQYGDRPSVDDVGPALAALFDSAPVLLPVGLFHEDHVTTHDAGLGALARHAVPAIALYEDCPYRSLDGGRWLHDRLAEVGRTRRLRPVRIEDEDAAWAKDAAVRCYRSQLVALASVNPDAAPDTRRPEGYWVLDGGDDWL